MRIIHRHLYLTSQMRGIDSIDTTRSTFSMTRVEYRYAADISTSGPNSSELVQIGRQRPRPRKAEV
jgi:hypothetical protein